MRKKTAGTNSKLFRGFQRKRSILRNATISITPPTLDSATRRHRSPAGVLMELINGITSVLIPLARTDGSAALTACTSAARRSRPTLRMVSRQRTQDALEERTGEKRENDWHRVGTRAICSRRVWKLCPFRRERSTETEACGWQWPRYTRRDPTD